MQKTRRAFTLIELLVVIAIIALLLTIVMPSLSKVKKKGKEILCLNNIRQLSIGMRLYTDESKGKTPPITYVTGQYWFHLIAPYLGTTKNYDECLQMETATCPEATEVSETWAPTAPWGTRNRAWFWEQGKTSGSYGMNMWLCPDGLFSPFVAGNANAIGKQDNYYVRYTDARGGVPIFSDSIWVGMWPTERDMPPASLDGEASALKVGLSRAYIDRHAMAVNIGFIDTSVQNVALKSLWQLKWGPQFQVGDMPVVRTSP